MNGRERIIAALELREPDRVPLYIHGINEAPIIGLGRKITSGLPEVKQFQEMTDQEKIKLMDTLFLIHEVFEVDGFSAFEIGHEHKVDEKHVRDDFGVVYQLSAYGLPVPRGHPIRDAGDLKRYVPPRPKREHLLLLDLARERFQGRKALFWLMRGSFVRSWRLLGLENMMLKMFDDPQLVHRVAGLVLDYNLQLLDSLVGAGLDVLVVEDDVADKNFPMISPDQFKEFVNPYNARLVAAAHAQGLKAVQHSDGNLWPLLDILLETGYDGLNPLEPQAGMDLARVKAYCGDRLCLIGNIDCVDLLVHGAPEEVREAVRKAIAEAGRGGGLIVSESNSLHPGVNPDNCQAMFEAVREFGYYPVA
ncbi:MAG: uroporphyrinogen decarboxylase family protein [Thermodesulfobacteriota bacterium]